MKIKISYFLFCVVFLGFACSKSQENVSATTPPPSSPSTLIPANCATIDSKFSTAVLPIIQNSCAISGCHNSGSGNGPGALTNFFQINAAASAIKSSVVNGRMPRGSSLSQLQIQAISCWVDGGALNN